MVQFGGYMYKQIFPSNVIRSNELAALYVSNLAARAVLKSLLMAHPSQISIADHVSSFSG